MEDQPRPGQAIDELLQPTVRGQVAEPAAARIADPRHARDGGVAVDEDHADEGLGVERQRRVAKGLERLVGVDLDVEDELVAGQRGAGAALILGHVGRDAVGRLAAAAVDGVDRQERRGQAARALGELAPRQPETAVLVLDEAAELRGGAAVARGLGQGAELAVRARPEGDRRLRGRLALGLSLAPLHALILAPSGALSDAAAYPGAAAAEPSAAPARRAPDRARWRALCWQHAAAPVPKCRACPRTAS